MDKGLKLYKEMSSFYLLEVDKLMQKRQRQDGYLNDADKEQMEDYQRKIAARSSNEEDISVPGQKIMIFYIHCFV